MPSGSRLPDQWQGTWISPAEPDEAGPDRPAYVLARDVDISGPVAEACLFVTALGVYEAFLDGVRVGDAELTPGSTNYDRTVHAQCYDVAALLHPGVNRLELVLSDGWYRGRTGSGQLQDGWGQHTAALAQLEVRYVDGERSTVATDGRWTSHRSQIVRADLMTGQTTDFTAPSGSPLPVRDGLVDPPEPTVSPAPPVRRIEELRPHSVRSIAPGVSVVDFGQNIAGWVRLSDVGAPGSETTLEFGEHLDPDGDLTVEHLDTHTPQGAHVRFRQLDRVVAGTGDEVFEPRHTVHGFRYVRITHPGRSLSRDAVTAVVVHTDLVRTGWFECNDDRLDRLHAAGVWSFRGNAVDVPTDCPTRERLGWTGDYQVFIPTAATLFDVDGFTRKWLQALRDDQYDNGSPAMFSPDPLRMRLSEGFERIGGGSAGWGDAAVAVPWQLYRHYGDDQVLHESWPSARAWVEYALACARDIRHPSRVQRSPEPAPHERFIWDGPFHFGEWLEPRTGGAAEPHPAAGFQALLAADHGDVGTAYLYRSATQLAAMAEVLGMPEDAARYSTVARQVRDAWRTEFLLPGGRTDADSQASYVRAIGFGLMPAELVPAAAARLVALIAGADGRLGTGFLSTGMLLPVLADTGHSDVAYSLLTRTGTPSWLEMLERGATTFWEEWEGVDEHGVAHASLNHYSKGAVVGFLYSHVAGLRQDPGSAGWQHFTVAPLIGGGLTHASATLHTARGPISASWRREGDQLTVTVSVPEGAPATARLPGGETTVLPAGATTTLRSRIPAP
jgi:alpha-L-rhamnosidase